MLRAGSWLGVFLAVLSIVAPLPAQALQDLSADMQMNGGALASPATGALYVSGSAARIEISMDGQNVIILGDPSTGSMNILMPEQGIYMPLSAGMSPVSVPPVSGYNPADPCSSGEVTNCVSLGSEQVNGYDAAGWQYDSNGETWTAWIATELSFPVRLIGADGTTTDFSNIAMGPQDASLFEIPANLQPMPGFGGFAGALGGGGGAGAPSGAPTGNADASGFGFPPGFDPAAFGLDPAAAADALAAIDAYDVERAALWEAGDGWLVQYTITASGESTESGPTLGGSSEVTSTYSIEYSGQVPLNYGAVGLPGTSGPTWQLIAGIGSAAGNAAEIILRAESTYSEEGVHTEECSIVGAPYTWTSTTTAAVEWNGGPATSENPNAIYGGGTMTISADLQAFDLVVSVGADATETTEGVTNIGACPPDSARSEPISETASRQYRGAIQLQGVPLPATPSTMSGTETMPMQFEFGGFSGELDATIEWTMSPI